jgi:hypothetical protein
MNFGFLRKKEFIWLAVLVALFLVLRLPAIHSPYHQDEYKWVQYSHPEITPPGTVPHPPLTEFIYVDSLGPLVGDNNFRLIPLSFGLVNLFLIFYLAKIIFDRKSAFWVAFLFVISFYSVLASLMVDVDGAVMPMFFLIMAIGYYKLRISNFKFQISNKKSWVWLILLVVGAVGGFLIKVSAVLPICALALDFAIERGVFRDKRKIIKYGVFGLLGAVGLVAVLFLAKFIFPFFNLEYSFNYWKHFANSSSFFDRGWLQTFIQFTKSVFYTSPLLLLPAFFSGKEIFKKTRPLFLFIFLGVLFYLFVFDFSIGALDRYFQFLVVPLCVISGAVFAKLFGEEKSVSKKAVVFISVISILIFFVQFLDHFVPPLYPKTEWISRVISLKWNFLFPFMGGSGPLPFYVSFGFVALIWIYSFALVIPAFIKNNFKKQALIGILVLGLLYNGVFIEEYLFGKINGFAPKLVRDSVEFVKNNKDVKYMRVYNDNGGFEVMEIGKYGKRLYLDPKFYTNQKTISPSIKGDYYLVVDIPHIDPNSMYAKYFSTCDIMYNQKSGKIEAFIYDCKNAPDIKI